jgi:hypothetical protein
VTKRSFFGKTSLMSRMSTCLFCLFFVIIFSEMFKLRSFSICTFVISLSLHLSCPKYFFQRHIFSYPQPVFFSLDEKLKFHTRTTQEVYIYFNTS